MGNACTNQADFDTSKVHMVSSLGMDQQGMALAALGEDEEVRTRGFSFGFGQAAEESKRKHEVKCPEGHVMMAHVVHELWMQCSRPSHCDGCEKEIEREAASYKCIKCHDGYTLCVDCAREDLGYHPCKDRGVPVVEILPGDIFLCGPDKNGIHHVVLARGELTKAGDVYRNLLDVEPGMELLACETIESTQGSVGEKTWWYPTTTIFQRNPYNGDVSLVADHPPESDVIAAAMEPVPMKILLHPLRGGRGQEELDHDAFEEVIMEAAGESKKYGKLTAVNSFLQSVVHQGTINPGDYPTKEKREQLMEKIRKSWTARPICASVAVKCWQKYFEKTCDDTEETVQRILDVMPHWCDKSAPSAMVKTLTQHGWVLLINFDD